MNVYFLHGFLGKASDFEQTMRATEIPGEDSQTLSVDYTKFRETSPQVPLDKWGEQFNQWIEVYEKGQASQEKRILVGYSQGGRMALHAWRAQPSFWQGLVLISTNPGLSPEERAGRLKADEEWALRFQNDDFSKTVEKWNAQTVFHGSVAEPERNEFDYNRHLLVTSLKKWSLGHQQDFRQELQALKVPVLYVTGERDLKYGKLGQQLHQNQKLVQSVVIPHSGHRVLFDAPLELAQSISKFIVQV